MRKLNYSQISVKAMKAFFQGWFVAILVMAAALAGNIKAGISKDVSPFGEVKSQKFTLSEVEVSKVKTENFLLAQTQIKTDELELPVALPDLAQIVLKGGNSSSGRVVGIDANTEALSIERSGKTGTIPLSQIQKVIFKTGALVYRRDGSQFIRGERNRPTGKAVTWSGIPLNAFTVKNPAQGQAVVKLKPPIVSTAKLQGIQSVARDRQYVVDEIQFNQQQRTIAILAKPY